MAKWLPCSLPESSNPYPSPPQLYWAANSEPGTISSAVPVTFLVKKRKVKHSAVPWNSISPEFYNVGSRYLGLTCNSLL